MRKSILALAMASLFATSAYANGPADKVTGDFVRVTDLSSRVYECEFTAHEAVGKRSRKGSMYCNRTDAGPDWWEVDLGGDNACVVVKSDSEAVIGGLVGKAEGNNLLTKFVAFKIIDGGEPGAYVDELWVQSQFTAAVFAEVCAGTKDIQFDLNGGRYYVEEGNIQVHNFGTDGD